MVTGRAASYPQASFSGEAMKRRRARERYREGGGG